MALNKAGVVVEALQVARSALPGWLQKRLAAQKQSAPRRGARVSSPTASRATCSPRTRRCRSWRCSRPKASLSFETVRDAVADVARFDTNVAAEALLKGETERYLRVLDGLRERRRGAAYLLFTISSALFALSAPGGWVSKALQRTLAAARALQPPAALARAITHAAEHRPRDQGRRPAAKSPGKSSPSSASSCTPRRRAA